MTVEHASRSPLPGFRLTLGFTLFYLSLWVLLPIAVLASRTTLASMSAEISKPAVQHAIWLSLRCAALAALADLILGTITAWTLTRYRFPGRSLLDALIDLPFALPTAVAGISLTALYAPTGMLGEPLKQLGITVAYTELGIIIALMFVGFPFVVRTVQPIIADLPQDLEHAASSLGASKQQTFWKVIFPTILPGCVTGAALAFARGIGEYGSVIFISGNMPGKTEILPVVIMTRLEEFNYAGAQSIALLMLLISFVCMLLLNYLQQRVTRG